MSNKEIEISVIIPCYNSEETIRRALESLEKQIFESFEVLIINDGSTDNTEKIIREYMKITRMRIQYLFQDNQGVSAARNNGLKIAAGKYISFLDSDDEYSQDFLSNLIIGLKKFDSDTSYCGYMRESELNLIDSPTNYKLNHFELMKKFMYREGPSAFCTFLYKKVIIQNNNLCFNINNKYGEDLEFTWKYLSHCTSGVFINKKMYFYHDNPNSAINTVNWDMVDAIEAVINVDQYLKEDRKSVV